MAYSSVTKPEDHFNTVLWTGNNTARTITGVGYQPDWVWIKRRSASSDHLIYDSIRGAQTTLKSNSNAAEITLAQGLTAFAADGFSIGTDGDINNNTSTYVAWNWLAGGTAPTQTYTVKVVSDSGNKYRFDDFGTSAVTLDLQEGGTYTFDQSDSSNSGHPLRFATAADAAGGTEYTTGVTTTGTPGSSGAQTVITVAASAPTLYYYCTNHSGMGGQANTNSTHGSSNFSGSIQSTVSANTTAGFSVTSWTGTGSASTVGHGLSSAPQMLICKNRDRSANWVIYHNKLSATPQTSYTYFTTMGGRHSNSGFWNSTAPTSSVFSIGTDGDFNASGEKVIGYCLSAVKGYSKFGSYTGNGNSEGPFIYTGFKPAFVIIKKISADGENWWVYDNKRNTSNLVTKGLYPNASNAEVDYSATDAMNLDFVSNGFKLRASDGALNGSSATYIYMTFAENPFVANDSGTVVPGTAR